MLMELFKTRVNNEPVTITIAYYQFASCRGFAKLNHSMTLKTLIAVSIFAYPTEGSKDGEIEASDWLK